MELQILPRRLQMRAEIHQKSNFWASGTDSPAAANRSQGCSGEGRRSKLDLKIIKKLIPKRCPGAPKRPVNPISPTDISATREGPAAVGVAR